jgi:hypothetical protein
VHVGDGIEPPVSQLVCLSVSLLGLTPALVLLMPCVFASELELDDAFAAFCSWPLFDFAGSDAAGAGCGSLCCAAGSEGSAFFSWPGACVDCSAGA